ncbi:hypothetical protein Cme02nite_35120 [Catellatospora methionotrophica]|uniref:Clp R domain-containing protein n=1 Tax=Catellatospora methionotrophica TaxID=121620 RepID=A0A8J3LM50_9ACTN|nr:Clp protease N-terminal domain-containing protein [Catellatospora methionotrophica]GIG15180.1 hypothetical protein Cme02nite_35120 [Catellatospora methionotrophica]
MLDRFTEEARQALVMAQRTAGGLRYDTLDSGTLLLGLLTDHADPAVRALAQQGINFASVHREIAASRPAAFAIERNAPVPWTPETAALIDAAHRLSRRLKHKGVLRTGHLVLAMVRDPESVAAQTMRGLGADFAVIEMAVTAGHMPSLPADDAALSADFRALLVDQARRDWPKPRVHVLSAAVSVLGYLATLAFIVLAGPSEVGPELVVGLAAAGLAGATLLHGIRLRWVRVPAPAGASLLPSPPELTALVARWGITDLAIWLRDDYRLDDHAARIGTRARIGVSREVYHRPAESAYVIAHELAHLVRNDPGRHLVARQLWWSLVLPALVTGAPSVWIGTAASLVLHTVIRHWTGELGSDQIAVALHGHEQMASYIERTHSSRHWPSLTHPPFAWRLWLARRQDQHP